jgi:hypothetical protein
VSTDRYILNAAKEPVQEPDLIKWARWWDDFDNRVVSQTEYGPYRISTVFLGIDHRFGSDGPPILFETMVFYGKSSLDEYQERCSTWHDAFDMHTRGTEFAYRQCRWDIQFKLKLKRLFKWLTCDM